MNIHAPINEMLSEGRLKGNGLGGCQKLAGEFLKDQLRKSLTWDRGMELADNKTFIMATDTKVYFCDPRSPLQRGTNENTNRLLRQYFPKGTDLSVYSQSELNKVARKLNPRPRKTLGYETPADKLQASVASIS